MSTGALLDFVRAVRRACDDLERALAKQKLDPVVKQAVVAAKARSAVKSLCRCGHEFDEHGSGGKSPCRICARGGALGTGECPYFHTRVIKEAVDTSGKLGVGHHRVLNACAQAHGGVLREVITLRTGFTRATRDLYIQALVRTGYVEVSDRGAVRITDLGRTHLNSLSITPLPEGSKLLEWWCANKLGAGEAKVLREIAAYDGNLVKREKISAATGYTRATRDLYIQKLKRFFLVRDEGRGSLRVNDILLDD